MVLCCLAVRCWIVRRREGSIWLASSSVKRLRRGERGEVKRGRGEEEVDGLKAEGVGKGKEKGREVQGQKGRQEEGRKEERKKERKEGRKEGRKEERKKERKKERKEEGKKGRKKREQDEIDVRFCPWSRSACSTNTRRASRNEINLFLPNDWSTDTTSRLWVGRERMEKVAAHLQVGRVDAGRPFGRTWMESLPPPARASFSSRPRATATPAAALRINLFAAPPSGAYSPLNCRWRALEAGAALCHPRDPRPPCCSLWRVEISRVSAKVVAIGSLVMVGLMGADRGLQRHVIGHEPVTCRLEPATAVPSHPDLSRAQALGG